jgi:hypothetical protein
MAADVQKTAKPPAGDAIQNPDAGVNIVDGPGLAAAARVLGDVWRNEETRFSNLNTRAVAILSAASIVTTVLNFFSKNSQEDARGAIYIALALLVATALIIIFGVLKPGPRYIFGNNDLTNGVAFTAQGNPPSSAADIDKLACNEYLTIYRALATRSKAKAYWLTFAYYTFGGAILASAIATGLIVHNA